VRELSLLVEQLITFGMLVGTGMVMAFIFDIYRVFRWLLKLPKLLVHFVDLVIWLIMAVMVFYILILGNWGEVRFYIFLGLLVGLAIYFKFCSKKASKLFLISLDFCQKSGKLLIKTVTFPVKIVGMIIVVPLGIISMIIRKIGGFLLLPFKPLISFGKKSWQNLWAGIKKLTKKGDLKED
jgi:spore cortex biosynthesis protein YabQ